MATVKLYDQDAYMTDFEAKVLSCEGAVWTHAKTGEKLDCYAVVLDRTAFFPEEGGQSSDKGALGNASVIDVQIDKENTITHYVTKPFAVGDNVSGRLDFEHRFSNMQQHSAEHIFSGLVLSMFGFNNVGFHLSDNSVTMDYNGVLSKEDIRLVERKVNEAIVQNIEIKAFYPSDEELKATEYRLKKELKGPIRLVIIPGYDACACCAPHVHRTGEIGMLKVIAAQNYKGGVRLHILCGFRALAYFNSQNDLIDSLTDLMTTGKENLLSNINLLKEENRSLSSGLAQAKQKLLLAECGAFSSDISNLCIVKEDTDNLIMRNVLNELIRKHDGICAFFAGIDGGSFKYLLASVGRDVRPLQKALSEHFGAKGGGKPEMVQGSLTGTKEEILRLFSEQVTEGQTASVQ